jgi:hypothetical protein
LSYARGAINETKLLALGQRLAAHACFKYSRACRAIRAGIDMLRSQASSYDGALAALESKCPGRLITPEVADEAARLRAQYTRIRSAISTAWTLASNASNGAAKDFLTASIYNTADLKIIAAYAKDHPERIPGLVFGAAATTGLPATAVRAMSQAEINAQLQGILAATEAAGTSAATRSAAAIAGRVLLRGAGIGIGVALDLVLFPAKLGDGTLAGYLLDNGKLTDTVTGTILKDSTGEEVEPEPQPDGGGARDGGPPCDDIPLGPLGPGEWVGVNRNYSDKAIWWKYEELITGHKRGAEYQHNNVKFEGYEQSGNQHTFTEAKGPGIKSILDGKKGPAVAEQKLTELSNQMIRQLKALRDVPDAKLRWVMAEEGYFEKVKQEAIDSGELTEADLAKLDPEYVPMDWNFEGCD